MTLYSTIYYTLIKAKLQYGLLLWGHANKTTLKPVNIIHNKAIRYLSNADKRARITPLYKEQNILQLSEMHKHEKARYMYDLYNNLTKTDLTTEFIQVNNIHNYCTRQAKQKNYYPPRAQRSHEKNSLLYSGPILWNAIPIQIKNKPKKQFQKLYYEYLQENYT